METDDRSHWSNPNFGLISTGFTTTRSLKMWATTFYHWRHGRIAWHVWDIHLFGSWRVNGMGMEMTLPGRVANRKHWTSIWYVIPSTCHIMPYSCFRKYRLSRRFLLNASIVSHFTWLVVWLPFGLFSHMLGMSSSQLTFIFFKGVQTTNQIHDD